MNDQAMPEQVTVLFETKSEKDLLLRPEGELQKLAFLVKGALASRNERNRLLKFLQSQHKMDIPEVHLVRLLKETQVRLEAVSRLRAEKNIQKDAVRE